jgi:hypothetical protein
MIDVSLLKGFRGLAGRTSLPRLLAEHRGRRNNADLPRWTHDEILAWADDYHAAHGRWPTVKSGPVSAAPGTTWNAVEMALQKGRRGLPGGSTLARLLAEHRGCRNRAALPPLTGDQIRTWADAYRATHGRWPNYRSGPVSGAPGETWSAINHALEDGKRGLGAPTTLSRLLRERAAPLRR